MSDDGIAVYLDGRMLTTRFGSCFCGETQAVLLLARYCENVYADAVIVADVKFKVEPELGVKVPEDCFSNVSYCTFENIPVNVNSCNLPAAFSNDGMNVYSGLCTVLRHLVKRAARLCSSANHQQHVLSLLGHRLYCLKACSEVSPRTKLCEFYMPDVFKHDVSDTTPKAISLFEKLLSEPVIIHNMDKRQRVLLQRIGTDSHPHSPNKRQRKQVVWTQDLPLLEHVFAEGVDFSLTDICVFPSIQFYLKHCSSVSNLPLIFKWYKRQASVVAFQKAIQECGIDFIKDFGSDNESITCDKDGVTQVLELADASKEHSNIDKKDDLLTIRRDLPGLVKKLESEGFTATFDEYDVKKMALAWNEMPKPLHPVEGELGTLRASRKCSQIENLAFAVKSIAKDGDTVVDFCSGGGHVGIVLAYLLPQCEVRLVENKEESLERARSRIKALNLKNITIYQCNLENFSGEFQIGVALHACGVATDMVVQSCMAKNASFVVSPCCYGKVRNCHWVSYPQSDLFKKIPLSFEESLLLGHAADKTSWKFEDKHAMEGKLCMGFVDTDRCSAARERGYTATLYTMQPPECSPKNNLLVGISPERRLNAVT